jgi:hypothetical protein
VVQTQRPPWLAGQQERGAEGKCRARPVGEASRGRHSTQPVPRRGEHSQGSPTIRNDIILPPVRPRVRGARERHSVETTICRRGALLEAASGTGLADGGETVDTVRTAEVFVAVPGPVGKEDVGGAEAQLPGGAPDALREGDGAGPGERGGVDAVHGQVFASATAAGL